MKRWFSVKAEQRISAKMAALDHPKPKAPGTQVQGAGPLAELENQLPALPSRNCQSTQHKTMLTPASLWMKEPSTSPVSPTSNKYRVPSPSKQTWQVFYGPGLNVTSGAKLPRFQLQSTTHRCILGCWLILVGPQFSHMENGETGTHFEGLIQVKGTLWSAHRNGLWSALGNNSSYLTSPLPSRCLARRLCSVGETQRMAAASWSMFSQIPWPLT